MARHHASRLAVVAVTAAVWVLAPAAPAAAQTARAMYEAAQALEADARKLVARTPPASNTRAIDAAVRAGRRAAASYESVVRRFPRSGYSDNALLNGGDLSRLLFAAYARGADRRAAIKYYGWLTREYPASSLRADARVGVRALDTPALAAATKPPASLTPAPPVTPSAPVSGASAAPALEPAPTSTVSAPVLHGIDREVLPDIVRVTLQLDHEVPFSHEMLDDPTRAFLDLEGVVPAPALQDASIRFDDEAIRQVRVGRQPTATRVVLDLDGAPRVSVFALYNPFRVVIDTERVPSAAPPSAGVGETSALAPGLGGPGEMPAAAPALPLSVAAARATSPAPPAAAPAPAVLVSPPEPPSANADGSFSIARQLGLGISRIVIDPGHGGHDPGTLTRGSSEAAIVLDVALRLERLLGKEPGLDVVLTRRTDVFIPLEQRTAIANREGADLFVSIHANASRNPKASGIETYYLSFASNPEAEAVAARENSTSARDMHNLPSIVRAIALNNKLDESRDLAGMLQDTLVTRLRRANAGAVSRGVKKAPFVVLIGAGMPSVLAEIGFLTNTEEAALVKTPAYRQRIAESLHAAILRYRKAVKQQSAVATR